MSQVPDASNGNDRNKKPQEEEELKISFADIPSDITEHCLALTRRCHYPNLSLASKDLHRILRTPELYETRTTLGVTEPILYASIGFPPFESPSWYTLHADDHVSSRHLRKIASLPSRLLSAVAAVGTEMYVIGGSVGGKATSDVDLIDFRFHTSRSLPSMKRTRSRAVAGAIDGKVYVIGGCRKKSDDWVEAFDVKTQTWREMPGVLPRAHWEGQFVTSAVMDDKIFVLDPSTCLVFDPKVGVLVEWEDGGELMSLWQASSCVVDDMLYSVDPGRSLKYPIVVYDPKGEVKRWRPVYGVHWGRDWPSFSSYYDSKMANLGGKLMILVCNKPWSCFQYGRKEVWCVEIGLERHGDEMFGRVESTKLVLVSEMWPSIELSRTVTL
ncbi:putative F-box/kelch-repeat protein At2g29810 [Raphanus sativus]|uniref:F-box/kelch-repeat protein At2g29810 n=1 Tax=Raphanus sativus TaxID=3726 RepID=A0A9W3DHQ8_RAPSA|nr:putative F-box/kelch-repeat protein At2g29810 [Raphanus sativus]